MRPLLAASASLLIACAAWAGLALLVQRLPPSLPFLAGALALVVIAVAATTMPLWLLIRRRLFARQSQRAAVRIAMRQGLWTGLYAGTLLALRVLGFLDWVLLVIVTFVFLLLESLLQQRDATPPQPAARTTAKPGANATRRTATVYQRTKPRPQSPPERKPKTKK